MSADVTDRWICRDEDNPKTAVIFVRLAPALDDIVIRYARFLGVPKAEVVRRAIEFFDNKQTAERGLPKKP